MDIKNILLLKDNRINCLSLSGTVCIGQYITWFNQYGKNNKLDEQRPVLNTRSANAIRKRLVDDIASGAIIPPIVIGIAVDEELEGIDINNAKDIVEKHLAEATVIDGMQRSGALCEALSKNSEIASIPLRIEFWLSNDTASLIYRMLVLNTGQTPWDVKRQMEVIYKPLVKEIRNKVNGITINERNDTRRRTGGGEYQASSIVEMFLAFSSKKEQVNTRETLSDDFTRLEVAQMAGEPNCSKHFFTTLSMLVKLDKAFSKYVCEGNTEDGYHQGMDIFTEQPSKIGFVVAVAQKVLGRAGAKEKSLEEQDRNMNEISAGVDRFVQRLDALDNEGLGEFLAFDSLNEAVANIPKKNIGNRMRAFFLAGFEALISDKFDVDNLSVVWLAY